MSEKEKKTKIVYEERILCPHCNERIVTKKLKTLVSPAVSAVYEEDLIVEKDKQMTLEGEK